MEVFAEIDVEGGKIVIPADGEILESGLGRKRSLEMFSGHKAQIAEVLRKDGGEIVVNWNRMKMIIEGEHYRLAEDLAEHFNVILSAIGILTQEPIGAWTFSEPSMNPRFGWSERSLYFKREEDIDGYARAWHKGSAYHWLTFKIERAKTKKDVCI